ncbi:MAG: DivIVA domain-containing protein [Actinomycetota bacterium]
MDSLAESLQGRSFEVARRGYDRKQVDGFLSDLATQVGALEEELREALIHMRALELRQRGNREAEVSVESAYVAAAEAKHKLLTDAEEKAASMLREAEMEAAQLLAEPRTASEKARKDAEGLLLQAQARLESAEKEATSVLAAAEARRSDVDGEVEVELSSARDDAAAMRDEAARDAERAIEEASGRAEAIIQEATEQASEVYETERRRAIDRLAQSRDEYEEIARRLRALKDATGDMLTNALRDHEAIRVVLDESSVEVS